MNSFQVFASDTSKIRLFGTFESGIQRTKSVYKIKEKGAKKGQNEKRTRRTEAALYTGIFTVIRRRVSAGWVASFTTTIINHRVGTV